MVYTHFTHKYSQPLYAEEYSQVKWVPPPLISDYSSASKCLLVHECDIALERYRIPVVHQEKLTRIITWVWFWFRLMIPSFSIWHYYIKIYDKYKYLMQGTIAVDMVLSKCYVACTCTSNNKNC